jgi:hypothetical protein
VDCVIECAWSDGLDAVWNFDVFIFAKTEYNASFVKSQNETRPDAKMPVSRPKLNRR